MNFHLLDQSYDAQVATVLGLIGVVGWLFTLCQNYRWMKRANGHRPFVELLFILNVGATYLACSFFYNSLRITDLSDDHLLQFSYYSNRTVIAVGPLIVYRLRRKLRGNH